MNFYYEYKCDDSAIIDAIIQDIPTLRPSQNHTNTLLFQKSNSYYRESLFTWINKCLADLSSKEFINTINLVVTECWLTRSKKFEKHHRHTHPNSIISGILYLDNSTNGTDFYITNPWAFTESVVAITTTSKKKVTIPAEKGKLILFPSNIEHETKTNMNETRHTLAFNTFLTGTIGNPTTLLSINSSSVDSNREK